MNFLRSVNAVFRKQKWRGSCFKHSYILTSAPNQEKHRTAHSWKGECVFMLSRVQLFCDTVDSSPPGSSVHGILQARILEWVARPSSRGSSWPRSPVSCIAGILYCWATGEARKGVALFFFFSLSPIAVLTVW